jgi:hypothetical protein
LRQFDTGAAAFGTGETENMHQVFVCEISDDQGSMRQRYAVSAGNELEVREAMLRYLGADFSIKSIREISEAEIRKYGEPPAGTIALIQ